MSEQKTKKAAKAPKAKKAKAPEGLPFPAALRGAPAAATAEQKE